jgi:hypothetical protein
MEDAGGLMDTAKRGRKFYKVRDERQRQSDLQLIDRIQKEQMLSAEARRRKLVELQLKFYNQPYLRGIRAKR